MSTEILHNPELSVLAEDNETYFRRRAFSESDRDASARGKALRRRRQSGSPAKIRLPPPAVTFAHSLSVDSPASPIVVLKSSLTQSPRSRYFSTSSGASEDSSGSITLLESSNISSESVRIWSKELIKTWLEDGPESYQSFEALLQLLEIALDTTQDNYVHFSAIMDSLEAETVIPFIKVALPYLVDSDFTNHTDYIDIMLMYLALYQVHTGQPILEDVAKQIPEFGGFYLRQHGKRFEELFMYIHSNEEKSYDEKKKVLHVKIHPHYLTCLHKPEKKVIVSNAPPIKLKRRRLLARNKFECDVSAGGLVSGIKPSLGPQDVWVSYLEPKLLDLDRMPKHVVPRMIREGLNVLPKIRRSTSVLRYSLSVDESEETKTYNDFLYEKAESDFMSLQRRLHTFAEKNFIVNPLIILKEDHKGFYNGISNGLFWPAFHNLPEFIVDEYKTRTDGEGGKTCNLAEDWQRYIKVNFHFAIHAARSCRQQDFLWIHDYHLFLAGAILRSLDPSLDCGFFLHIPFRLSEEFMAEFREQGLAVLIGLLGFTRVGFQSNKDTLNFVRLVKNYVPNAQVQSKKADSQNLRFRIAHGKNNALVTDAGTFPISIKMEKLLEMVDQSTPEMLAETRQRIMGNRKGKLFVSVERFDYTKGILERLAAIQKYLETNPDRASMDVFYQIAAASRTDISSYRRYQTAVLEKVDEINTKFSKNPDLPVLIVDQSNQPQEVVVQLYQVSDIALITPMADGMNLVIKEAILCNPKIILVLSTGSGAENQFFDAGFGDCYIRISNIANTAEFAKSLNAATQISEHTAENWGRKLYKFTKDNDIDYWIESFTNPGWTSDVIQERQLNSVDDFHQLGVELHQLRQTTTSKRENDDHIGVKTFKALENCLRSLQKASPNFEICEKQSDSASEQLSTKISAGIDRIKRDIRLLQMNWDKNTTVDDWVISCAEESGLPRSIFDGEMENLFSVLRQFQPADLLICDYKILSKEGINQTAVSGFLLNRFFNRFAVETLIVSGENSLAKIAETTCFPESFSAGFTGIDKVKIDGKIMANLKPDSGIVGQLQTVFRANLSLTNWLRRKIVIFGSRDTIDVADWLAEKEGAIVTFISLDGHDGANFENLVGGNSLKIVYVSNVEVLYAVAIRFILDNVITASYAE